MRRPSTYSAEPKPQTLVGLEAVSALARPLDDLHAAVGTPVTARRTWLEAWARAFPTHEPWIIAVWQPNDPQGQLDAVAMLARSRTAGVTTIVGMGHGHADHMRLPYRDDTSAVALATAVTAALRQLGGPWRLTIEQLPPGDPVADRITGLLPHAHLRAQPGDGIPVQHLGPTVTAEQFLSKSERKDRRRLRRRLDEQGEVEVACTRCVDRIAALLPELAALRTRRDHQQGRVSELDADRGRRFWESVILDLAALGQVEVATLRCDGTLLSYTVMLLDGDACRLWDGRFDPDWSRYAPGSLIDQAALERALECGFDLMDLMRGETGEKLRHASAVLPTVALRAWSAAALQATDTGTARARDWAKARKDASPALQATWRKVKEATVLRGVDGS